MTQPSSVVGMENVAILGGTFDPVHLGHLLIAQTALNQMGLERVFWVPNRHPLHKVGSLYEHRQAMVARAIADNPIFTLPDLETDEVGIDYAFFSLQKLQEAYPNCHWYWILGIDAFTTLPRWYRREQLVPACDWLVAPRPLAATATADCLVRENSSELDTALPASRLCQQVALQLASQNISLDWQLLQVPPTGISSSLIRQYCREHRSIRYLVPESVRAYITTHNIYTN